MLSDFFERIYIINLPHRHDRRHAIMRELKQARILPHAAEKVEIFPGIQPESAEEFPSIGARGCFLSHLSILKRAKADRLANVLVLEDDLAISKYLRSCEAALVNQLTQQEWGFVYFGHSEAPSAQDAQVALIPYSDDILRAHFYGVNSKIFDRLTAFLEVLQHRPSGHPDGGPMHLDGAYNIFRQQNPSISTFITSNNLGWQRSSRSDIAQLAWFDRLPVIKQIATTARISKYWLQQLPSN